MVEGRSGGTFSAACVHPAPATSRPFCTTTNRSLASRPERAFTLRSSARSNGTDAIT
jgi:hypothetical protein